MFLQSAINSKAFTFPVDAPLLLFSLPVCRLGVKSRPKPTENPPGAPWGTSPQYELGSHGSLGSLGSHGSLAAPRALAWVLSDPAFRDKRQ